MTDPKLITLEMRTPQTASNPAFALQLIEDFRAMQEGTEVLMLAALLRNSHEIPPVTNVLRGVRIPAPMHRSHSEIFNAIGTTRSLGRSVTVNACIDYLNSIGRLERAGGREKVMTIAAMSEDIATSPVDLAQRVAKYSRARINTGQEVWTVALYRWYDADGLLLYIGITEDLAGRTSSHERKSSWAAFAVRRTVTYLPDRASAETAERFAIYDECPLFNHQHNDTPEARQRLVNYLIKHGRTDLLAPNVSRG